MSHLIASSTRSLLSTIQRSTPRIQSQFPLKSWYSTPAGSLDTIKLQLKTDLKTSLSTKQKPRATVIKSILSDITYAEKLPLTTNSPVTEIDIFGILNKAVKKRVDASTQYRQAGRDDLAGIEEQEVEWIKSYLPTPYTEEEVEKLVRGVVSKLSPPVADSKKDLGRVMKEANASIDGSRVTKAVLANVVKRVLASL